MKLGSFLAGAAAAIVAVAAGRLLFDHLLPQQARVATEVRSEREPQVIPTNGGILVIARVKGYETFTRADAEPVDLGLFRLDLGTTVSEVRTAALYQYQIRLEKKWPIRCDARRCVVRTGAVELAAPVATFPEETSRRTESGWGRFDKAQNLEALNRELGPALLKRGNQPRNRDLALRDGRENVRKFVHRWLEKETGRGRDVVVLFPGETERAPPAAAL